jgi:hypothetical protein
LGPATSTCSIDNGLPASQATAARDFMAALLHSTKTCKPP